MARADARRVRQGMACARPRACAGLRLASRRSDVTKRLGALVRQSTMEISGSITPPNTSLCADRSGSGGAPLPPAYIVPRAYISSEGL
jgi:hypothetical protein